MQRRDFLAAALPAALLLAAAPARPAEPTLRVTPLSEGLWLIAGAGGNVVVLRNAAGVLMVDGGLAAHSAQLLKEVRRLTGSERVHTLFNTHWHPEQTGSNLVLGSAGTRIIAHENTRLWTTIDVELKWAGKVVPPLLKAAQPNETFYTDGAFDFGGERIEYGHLPQAHTDGDLFVHLRAANVLVAGDVVATGAFPVIDYCSNGWIGGLGDAVQALHARADAATRIVAGTGAVLGRDHLKAEGAMLATMRQRLSKLLAQGFSVQEMIDARPAEDLESQWGDAKLFIANAWQGMVHRTGELGVSIV